MVNEISEETKRSIDDIMKKLSHLAFHDNIASIAVVIIERQTNNINVLHCSQNEYNLSLLGSTMLLHQSVLQQLLKVGTVTTPIPTPEMPTKQ